MARETSRRLIAAVTLIALAAGPLGAQSLAQVTHATDAGLRLGRTVDGGPLVQSGRRLAADLELQSRRPSGRPSARSSCVGRLIALPLAGMALGLPIGWATMWGVTDGQPGRHIGRVMLIGGAVGLVAGAILCAR